MTKPSLSLSCKPTFIFFHYSEDYIPILYLQVFYLKKTYSLRTHAHWHTHYPQPACCCFPPSVSSGSPSQTVSKRKPHSTSLCLIAFTLTAVQNRCLMLHPASFSKFSDKFDLYYIILLLNCYVVLVLLFNLSSFGLIFHNLWWHIQVQ